MSDSADFANLAPATLQLENLPAAREVVSGLPEPIQSELRRELPEKPLLHLLSFLLSLAQTRDATVRAALMLLAKIAIARHPYTSKLYHDILGAILRPIQSSEPSLLFVIPDDANLVTEILSVQSRLAEEANMLDIALRSLELGLDLSRKEKLPLATPLLLYRLANLYAFKLKNPEFAEGLLAEAAELAHVAEPGIENNANLIRAALIATRTGHWDFPPLLQSFLDKHPDIALSVALGQAEAAANHNNLPLHERWRRHARHIPSSNPKLLQQLSRLDSILARRKGDWELADLRFRQHAALLEDTSGETELWDRFYLARDLGDVETAHMLLNQIARRKNEFDLPQLLYQRGLLAINEGKDEEAAGLFQECLTKSPDLYKRASCHGMLGVIPAPREQLIEHLFEAHRLFHRAGAAADMLIVLSHMAMMEIVQGTLLLSKDWPLFAVSPLARAVRLLERAQTAAEQLGDDDFLINIRLNLASVYQTTRNYRAALHSLDQAMDQTEWVYLRLTQQQMAERFAVSAGKIVSKAIDCAAEAQRPDLAVSIAERLKARRLFRDLAEIGHGAISDNETTEENTLLEQIRPLRRKLVDGRPLTAAEREALDEAQRRVRELRENIAPTGAPRPFAAGEPFSSAMLRIAVFGVAATEEPIADTPEPILPGVGMQCSCGAFNRTESTFCSACDAKLPKSARISLDGDPDMLQAEYGNRMVATSSDLLKDGNPQEAARLIEEARQLRRNPLDPWLMGLVRIVQGELDSALEQWATVKQLQFSFEDPFWPLPLSPSDLEDLTEACRREPARAAELVAPWTSRSNRQGAPTP